MKYASFLFPVLLACFASCDNQKEKEEPEIKDPVENSGAQVEGERATEAVKDSSKTTISVGKGGVSVKTKKGTGVGVDSSGIKVENKKVKIDIKRDSN